MVTTAERTETFTIVPSGRFALRELAEVGIGHRHEQRFDGAMRMAFVTDGLDTHAGVVVRQDASGVHVEVSGSGGVRAQVARVLVPGRRRRRIRPRRRP